MADKREFYRVINDRWDLELPSHLEHGYEERREYRAAIRRLLEIWHGRIGESVCERSDHIRLRFYDTPGGMPDEAWLPRYLLTPVDPPEEESDSSDGTGGELTKAFGFD